MRKPSASDCFSKGTIEILAVNPNFVLEKDDVEALVFAPARKMLFFDEKVPLYVLLHLPTEADHFLMDQIAHRVALTIEAMVTDNVGRGNAPPLVRQDSMSRLNRTEQGQVIFSKSLERSSHLHICHYKDHQVLVWRHEIPLSFTKSKSVTPRLSFAVSMTLSDKAFDEPNANAYIDSTDMTGRDMSYNLLRGLESDVFLRDNPPELSAARVSTMRPLADPMTKKTKKSAKRVFSVHSAIALRIRSFDIPASSRVILSIDLESPEDSKHALEFHSIELQVNQAKPNPIGECSFPFDLKDGEKYTYAFDLNFENLPVEIGGHIPATLIIHSRPVTHESESIRGPLLISKWSTTISVPQDVGTPLTHHLEDVARQRMQRSSSNLLQAARSSMLVSPSDSQTPLSGIVVTLRPPANGRIGQVIDIPVLVTNNASTPKTLNIDVSRAPRKKELPRAPLSESGSRALVLSDQALHETHAQCSAEGIDFICLTNHIKIGQLAGGAQVEVTLQYLAMREAIVELQDLRIVDVSSGVYHELKDLSTIHITT